MIEPDFDGPLVGERYRLGPLLGRGGQGSTHLALNEQTEEHVAVKAFDLGSADSWKDLELFQRECQALRQLEHPGIPTYHAEIESEEDGRAYLVMEYIEGQSLRARMRDRGQLQEAELWTILQQALSILAYLESLPNPVIHRDVKPSNLIRRPDGRLVVVDFGGVRLRLRSDGGSTVVGTLGYMAPEQLYGEATPATDLYGLGMTLITLGSGLDPDKLPRRGLRVDLDAALRASPSLKAVLSRLTEPEADDRPASAAGLLAEIKQTLQPKPAPPPPVPAAQRDIQRRSGSPLRLVPRIGKRRLPLPVMIILFVALMSWAGPLIALFVFGAIVVATTRTLRFAIRQGMLGPHRPGRPPLPRGPRELLGTGASSRARPNRYHRNDRSRRGDRRSIEQQASAEQQHRRFHR